VSFYEELGHDMRERRQYLDSAVIFGELVNKPDERFLSLCKAKAWDEALRVQSMHEVPGSGMHFYSDLKFYNQSISGVTSLLGARGYL
jgi:hypothetical protein